MTLIEIKSEPTSKELKIFAILLVIFGALFAALAYKRPEILLMLACLSGISTVLYQLFEKTSVKGQWWYGIAVATIFLVAYRLSYFQIGPALFAITALLAAVTLGVFTWKSPDFGKKFYNAWMLAFLPVGWALSHILLGIVYYGVITPIGLFFKLAGRDLLSRKIDPSAKSYWIQRKNHNDSESYFRQF